MSRPQKPLDLRKVDKVTTVVVEPKDILESLLIFDARCLDRHTAHELLRILPELLHIRRAWKAHFLEYGCISCHKKNARYGSGGFCNTCHAKIMQRMLKRHRKLTAGRNIPQEIAELKDALLLRYNAAQRLLGGEE